MKLRMQGDAIRFRLNRREVAEFAEIGRVSATVSFGAGAALTYTLAKSIDVEIAASFQGGELLVKVPAARVAAWAGGDEIGIEAGQKTGADSSLAIVIEKDFQCMHKGEDAKDPEAYPNPMAAA